VKRIRTLETEGETKMSGYPCYGAKRGDKREVPPSNTNKGNEIDPEWLLLGGMG